MFSWEVFKSWLKITQFLKFLPEVNPTVICYFPSKVDVCTKIITPCNMCSGQERLGCPVTDRKIDYAEIAKIWLVKFCMFNFKIVYLAEFSADLKIIISKSKLGYSLSKIKEILKIKQKTFVLLLIKRRYVFETAGMMIRCILTELLQCKVYEKYLWQCFFLTLMCIYSVRMHQIIVLL